MLKIVLRRAFVLWNNPAFGILVWRSFIGQPGAAKQATTAAGDRKSQEFSPLASNRSKGHSARGGGTAPVLPVFSRRSGDDQVGGILSRLWLFVEIFGAGVVICSRGAGLGLSAGLRKFGGAGARSRM